MITWLVINIRISHPFAFYQCMLCDINYPSGTNILKFLRFFVIYFTLKSANVFHTVLCSKNGIARLWLYVNVICKELVALKRMCVVCAGALVTSNTVD